LFYKSAEDGTAKEGGVRIALVWSGRDRGNPRRRRGRIAECLKIHL
jgi:hypothetical protein